MKFFRKMTALGLVAALTVACAAPMAVTQASAETASAYESSEDDGYVITPEEAEALGWDTDDPQWYREYLRENASDTADTSVFASGLGAASVTSSWKTYTNSACTTWTTTTFTHYSTNVSDADPVVMIDVSKWQGSIDWDKVAAAGVEGVIIRAAYRSTSSSGTLYTDSYFKKNIQGAQEAGLKVGVYIFSQAITQAEARKEAQYLISVAGSYTLDLPMVFDYEYSSGGRLATANLSKTKMTNITLAFCEEIEDSGYEPMVYASSSFFVSEINGSTIAASYPLWVARYNTYYYNSSKDSSSLYSGKAQMWQCSSTARVSGISGNTDLDFYYDSGTSRSISCSKSSVTKNSITVKWNSITGASGYQLYYSTAKDGTYKQVYSGSNTSYKLTGLNAGQQYYFKVRYYITGSSGTKRYSAKSSAAAIITTASTTLHVKTTSAAAFRKNAGTTKKKLASVAKGVKFTVKATTKDAKGNTWYKVTYKNQTGYIKKSKTTIYVPQVSSVKQTNVSKKTITVKWSKVSGATSYIIYRSNAKNGTYKRIAKVSADTLTYTDKNLVRGMEYYYKIRAVQKIGSTNYKSTATAAKALHTTKFSGKTVRTKSTVNLRKSAGTSYKVKRTIPSGKKLKVLYKTKDKNGKVWYKVQYTQKVNGKTKTYTGYVKKTTVK